MLQNSNRILRIRFPNLQLDATEYMGMPAAHAQHVFVQGEAFDIRRIQTRAGQQKLRLVMEVAIVMSFSSIISRELLFLS